MLRFYNESGYMTQYLICNDGRQIRISQSWPEWRDSVFGLMNAAMAASVVLGGSPVLHGSSLVHNGCSFFIMGISGAGKSSLSAALAALGMMTHSDDIGVPAGLSREGAAIGQGTSSAKHEPDQEHCISIEAGYGQLKVRPDLPERIGLGSVALDPVFQTPYAQGGGQDAQGIGPGRTGMDPGVNADNAVFDSEGPDEVAEERWLPAQALPSGFYPERAPLAGIFVLSSRLSGITKPIVQPLRGMPAVLALTEHLFGRDWLQLPSVADIALCRRLAASVPVWRVHMPDDLDQLMDSANMLLHSYVKPALHIHPWASSHPHKLHPCAQ